MGFKEFKQEIVAITWLMYRLRYHKLYESLLLTIILIIVLSTSKFLLNPYYMPYRSESKKVQDINTLLETLPNNTELYYAPSHDEYSTTIAKRVEQIIKRKIIGVSSELGMYERYINREQGNSNIQVWLVFNVTNITSNDVNYYIRSSGLKARLSHQQFVESGAMAIQVATNIAITEYDMPNRSRNFFRRRYPTSDISEFSNTSITTPNSIMFEKSTTKPRRKLSTKSIRRSKKNVHEYYYEDDTDSGYSSSEISFSSLKDYRRKKAKKSVNSNSLKRKILYGPKTRIPFEFYLREFPGSKANVLWLVEDSPLYIVVYRLTFIPLVLFCIEAQYHIIDCRVSGFKQLQTMAGLHILNINIGWIIYMLSFNIVIIITATVILSAIFSSSSGFLIFVILVLYTVMAMAFLMVLATFFNEPLKGNVLSTMIWIFTGFLTDSYLFAGVSAGFVGMISILLPPLGLYHVLLHYSFAKYAGQSVNFISMFREIIPGRHVPVGNIIITWFFMIFLFMAGSIYFDNIIPGRRGQAKKWYYPFENKQKKLSMERRLDRGSTKWQYVEEVPYLMVVAIRVRKLSKTEGPKVLQQLVLNNVTIDFYRGETTALLGVAGSGKTTLTEILTGQVTATCGSVRIMGLDVVDELDYIREIIGFCPQFSMLNPFISFKDHLVHFAMIKGMRLQDSINQSVEIIDQLEISSFTNELVINGSTVAKSCLCIGIGLTGRPKLLIMDEPTKFLDPASRTIVWSVLTSLRAQKTIYFTTELMEEAVNLADRIAIITEGVIQCFGTPSYLKTIFGDGYTLSIRTDKIRNPSKITAFLKSKIDEIELKHSMGKCFIYNIPSKKTNLFPNLFKTLNDEKDNLGIVNYDLTSASMEEVYLRVRSLDHPPEIQEFPALQRENQSWKPLATQELSNQQMRILFRKHFWYLKTEWVIYFAIHGFAIGVMIYVSIQRTIDQSPKCVHQYHLDYTSLSVENDVPFATDGSELADEIVKGYISLKSQHEEHKVNYLEVSYPLNDYLSIKWEQNPLFDITNTVIGGEFSASDNAVIRVGAFYTKKTYPLACGVSIAVAFNAIYRHFTNNPEGTITATVYPLKDPDGANTQERYYDNWQTLIPFSLLLVVSLSMRLPGHERSSGSKKQQLMTIGMSPIFYWGSIFTVDITVYLITCVILVTIAPLFSKSESFHGFNNLAIIFTLIFLYGLSGIPLAYLCTFIFAKAHQNYVVYISINMLLCTTFPVLEYFICKDQTRSWLRYIASFLPQYCLQAALEKFDSLANHNAKCDVYFRLGGDCNGATPVNNPCCDQCGDLGICHEVKRWLEFDSKDNPNGIALEFLYFLLSAIIYLTILMLIEYNVVSRISLHILEEIYPGPIFSEPDDYHVKKKYEEICKLVDEPERAVHFPTLVVHQLCKKAGGYVPAIRGISLTVDKGNIFGLVGETQSGKTVLLNLLTGNLIPNEGTAFLFETINLRKHIHEFGAHIGFCPGGNCFNDWMTVLEVMTLMALLRGIPLAYYISEINKWLNVFDLYPLKDYIASSLALCDKRRLDLAVTLLGNLPILIMDEPTNRLDPYGRRKICEILLHVCNREGRLILLTTKSIHICEGLCNTVGILVNGKLACVGTIHELKRAHGCGYKIHIKLMQGLNDSEVQETERLVIASIQGTTLVKEQSTELEFQIVDTNNLHKIFESLETLKTTSEFIIDYVISEFTLTEVYLSIDAQRYKEDIVNYPCICCPRQKEQYRQIIPDTKVPSIEEDPTVLELETPDVVEHSNVH